MQEAQIGEWHAPLMLRGRVRDQDIGGFLSPAAREKLSARGVDVTG